MSQKRSKYIDLEQIKKKNYTHTRIVGMLFNQNDKFHNCTALGIFLMYIRKTIVSEVWRPPGRAQIEKKRAPKPAQKTAPKFMRFFRDFGCPNGSKMAPKSHRQLWSKGVDLDTNDYFLVQSDRCQRDR